MKLLILPGGGNPEVPRNVPVYDLMAKLASSYGYTSIDRTIRWPGCSNPGEGDPGTRRTLDNSLETAREKIKALESEGAEYHVLGFCFGAMVATRLAAEHEFTRLKKFMLWGLIPYPTYWKLLVKDYHENVQEFRGRGTYIDETFFASLIPNELSLCHVSHRTVIAHGGEDVYAPPSFHYYLKDLFFEKSNLSFPELVKNAPHNVTAACGPEVVETYGKALFG
ncbi:MAG: hypothetical protein MN733_22480 [Nitrososphaera sp.]|nr:hypothetical protein [Nitrososphaera sp.]